MSLFNLKHHIILTIKNNTFAFIFFSSKKIQSQLLMKSIIAALGIFILSLFFLSKDAFSQRRLHVHPNLLHYDERVYHFGFSLGLNQMSFALKPVEDISKLDHSLQNRNIFDTLYSVRPVPEYGFNIGIVSNLKLGDQWDLRLIPTLTFGDRIIEYTGIRNNEYVTRTQKIESTFIDVPLHFKYKSVRIGNTRVYVIGGAKYSYDLASAEDQEDYEEEVIARVGRHDFFYELGTGIEHYFYYFKFSIEIKASFGINDMLARENTLFTNSIDQLRSQIVMVSFMFE